MNQTFDSWRLGGTAGAAAMLPGIVLALSDAPSSLAAGIGALVVLAGFPSIRLGFRHLFWFRCFVSLLFILAIGWGIAIQYEFGPSVAVTLAWGIGTIFVFAGFYPFFEEIEGREPGDVSSRDQHRPPKG